MKNKGLVILFLFAVLGIQPLTAQKFLWEADFVGFFDNREYKSHNQQSQTLFGTRLSPQVGIGTEDGRFRFMAGASWIQPIDTKVKDATIIPTIYFRHITPSFKMSFGIFPRTQLIEQLPDALFYDSLLYFSPNIRGALFQYERKKGYAEAYVDWRTMQTETDREAFTIILKGRYNMGLFFLGANVMMNHLARSKNSPDNISVMDDMVFNPYAGIDLSHRTFLDSLSIKCGYLNSLERNRGDGSWYNCKGFLSEVVLQWRFVGVKNIFYVGENQQPFYRQYGALFNQGDPSYQSSYNRTNIYCYFYQNSFVSCLASVNLHISKNAPMGSQQQLVVRMNLNNLNGSQKKKERQESILKNIF